MRTGAAHLALPRTFPRYHTDLGQSGGLPGEKGSLERVKPIYLPPYAPDHNPTEHVWNAAKAHISNIQQDTPEQSYSPFLDYITSRTFDCDFEHLPITAPEGNLV